ncbi:hypothetical protein BGZ46_008342 [Entomortierella lignicola]|nr:hypothetical protein BGZ46_008342 [Entomortierella lignicola]
MKSFLLALALKIYHINALPISESQAPINGINGVSRPVVHVAVTGIVSMFFVMIYRGSPVTIIVYMIVQHGWRFRKHIAAIMVSFILALVLTIIEVFFEDAVPEGVLKKAWIYLQCWMIILFVHWNYSLKRYMDIIKAQKLETLIRTTQATPQQQVNEQSPLIPKPTT